MWCLNFVLDFGKKQLDFVLVIDLNININMWYSIENKQFKIHFSDELITINPDLTTDLCAEILIPLLGINYWGLLDIFRNKDLKIIRATLKGHEHSKLPNFLENTGDHVIGCLLQKVIRNTNTNTYFIYENNTLCVSKESDHNNERLSIVKEKVLSGQYLVPKLSELINKNEITDFESLFIASIKRVFEKFNIIDNDTILKPYAIDCIAKNTIITEDGFDFFDIEYAANIILTKSHFLFRSALRFKKQYVNRKYWPYKAPYDLYLVFCKYFQIKPDVENDIKNEIKFLTPILDSKSKALSKLELSKSFYNTTPFLVKLFRWIKYKFN